jgi:hypothetical protein
MWIQCRTPRQRGVPERGDTCGENVRRDVVRGQFGLGIG